MRHNRFTFLIFLAVCPFSLSAQIEESDGVTDENDYEYDEAFEEGDGEFDTFDGTELDDETADEKKAETGPQSTDANSAKIIDLHIDALGGLEKIKTLKTIKLTGSFREGKQSWKMTWYRKAPNIYRVERYHRLLGRDYLTIKAFNGKTGWVREASPELKPPEEMWKGELDSFLKEAEFYPPLVDWREKGHHFAYKGELKILRKPTYFVQGKLEDGRDIYYYFNTNNFLLRQVGFKDKFAGATADADYRPVKMKKVNGIWMEEIIQYVVQGRVYKEIVYDTMLANIDMPDSLFEIPEVKEFILRQKSR